MDDYAADEWQRTWESLWDAGIVTHVDVGALAIYCQAHARWRRAEEVIQEIAKEDPENGGLVLVTTNGNIVQNLLVGIANTSMRDAIRYGAEFGLTPSSRAASVSCPPSRLTQRTNTLISSPLKTKTPPDVDPFVRKLILGEISKVIPLPVQ